jgi:hypothetical protein
MNKDLMKDLIIKLNINCTHYIYQRSEDEYTIVSREKKLELMLYYDASPNEFIRLNYNNLKEAKGSYTVMLI